MSARSMVATLFFLLHFHFLLKLSAPAFKSKVALEALAGRVNASAAGRRDGIHSNPVCQWKKSPVENSHRLFEDSRPEKDGQIEIPNRKVDALTGEIEYLKGQTGQLSMHERKAMINRETKRPACAGSAVCCRYAVARHTAGPTVNRQKILKFRAFRTGSIRRRPTAGNAVCLRCFGKRGYNINIRRVRRLMRTVRRRTPYPKKRTTL